MIKIDSISAATTAVLRILGTAIHTGLLYFVIGVTFHFLGVLDQPRPEYARGNWITHRLDDSLWYGVVLSGVMSAITLIDQALFRSRYPHDAMNVVYRPRFRSAKVWFRDPVTRMLIVAWLLAVAAWYADLAIEVWRIRQFAGGWVWPPERLFAVFLLSWGVLWLVDSLTRPANETILAAVLFLLSVLLLVVPMGYGILRE